ncbi:hypothetical protein Cgig2_027331 [Carnegiea gigantea]|uniref:Uncharacterized protein n=1 Tax=Carnegiea gigantea TaxID=171969 RepID=A0A9Q1GPL6_9CARY|nr:hypothetical protein Cgig2_027331 [Carnegiea gigantea]
MKSAATTGSGAGGGGSCGGGGSMSCEDCGNKAKRDCAHKRCRTCCKSRGFHCPTHVKSTWVPVARRRLRQQQHHHHHHLLSLPLSLSSTPSLQHHLTLNSSGPEEVNFPAEVNSLATFRCIRVSSNDNVVDQYAYQTSLNIGGHLFKGILYDQGGGTASGGGENSPVAAINGHQFRHQQLDISTSTTATAAAPPPPPSGANLLYHPSPPSLYSPPFNAFLPGMQFFPHPRP